MRSGPNNWPWRNFTRAELSCNHCGEYYHDPDFLDKLQDLRDIVGKPIELSSAHRCAIHNALKGGKPLSKHLKLAVDVKLIGHDRFELAKAAKKAGFTGFGYSQTFLHLDTGRARFWFYGERSKKLWQS